MLFLSCLKMTAKPHTVPLPKPMPVQQLFSREAQPSSKNNEPIFRDVEDCRDRHNTKAEGSSAEKRNIRQHRMQNIPRASQSD